MAGSGLLDGRGVVRVDPNRPGVILDQFGNPMQGDLSQWTPHLARRDPLKDVDRMVAAGGITRSIPITQIQSSWMIQEIRSAIDDHMLGQFMGTSMLCDQLIGDDRVTPTLGSRLGALFGSKLRHKRAESDPDGTVRKAWSNNWKSCGLSGALSDIKQQAILMGLGVAQVLWDTSVTPWRMMLRPWPLEYVYYRHDLRQFIAITQDGQEVIEPGNGRWFLHAPKGTEARPWVHGAIRAIAEKWFIKLLAWRDWARFNERHGLPIITADVPAIADPVQKSRFVETLSRLGQETVVMLPKNIDGTGFGLEMLEARDRAWETFQAAVDRADRAIVLAIKWQNLTTEINEGSQAAARVHGDVEQVALQFDNQTLSYDVHWQLARAFAAFNFGKADAAAWSRWDVTPPEDLTALATQINTLSDAIGKFQSQGVAVDSRKLLRKYRVPLLDSVDKKAGELFAYDYEFGIVTINEARARKGLPPVSWGDGPPQSAKAKEDPGNAPEGA